MAVSSPVKPPSSIWETLLTDPIPLIGKWGQHLAINKLSKSAMRGDAAAIHALMAGLSTSKALAFHSEIIDILSSPLPASSFDCLWQEWAARRLPVVEQILLEKRKHAGYRSRAWAISLAKLRKIETLQSVQPERLSDVLLLRADLDPTVAASASAALTGLSRQESRDEMFRLWSASRDEAIWQLGFTSGYIPQNPVEVRVLFLLKSAQTDDLVHSSPEMVAPLIASLQDGDPAIAVEARRCLPLLQNEAAINLVCQGWRQTRSPVLAEIIREGKMVAARPIELRLMTALIIGRSEIARKIPPEGIPILWDLANDNDPQLAQAARDALISLEDPAAQAAFCMLAVNQNLPRALELALSAGYRPAKPEQLALFLFQAGLWPEYDSLDFDNRLMQAAYETAQPALRQRIAGQVQRLGKSAYLSILAGIDFRSNTSQLSTDEIRLLVELLLENHEWTRLWSLVHLVPLRWGIRILQAFPVEGWKPDNPAEVEEYIRLTHLAQNLPPPARPDWESTLPPAISTARVRVSGRVNDVCFSPQKPLIAIGTGSRKLVTWDFQKAEIRRIRGGFNHSISKVAFVGSNYLVCGVRSNVDSACWIYGWQDNEAFVLPGHQGAITALLPIGDANLVSTGRDGAVIYWNLGTREEIGRQALPDWPRAAFTSKNQQQIVLMHSSLSILQLPNLLNIEPQSVRTAAFSGTRQSMALCGVFPPDTGEFLVGQRNGQVVRYLSKPQNRRITREAILRKDSSVVDLEFVPAQPSLVIAAKNGTIEFRHWPDLTHIGTVSTDTGRLTSLHLSADGAFMATGTDESTMQFWDLRVRDLPDLIDRPLANARPAHLAAVTALLLHSADAPTSLRRTLELAEALLQRRFRYDILVEELYQIKPGEFDIILE